MGGGLLLLPILMTLIEPKAAVAINTVGMLWNNVNKLWLFRRDLVTRVAWPLILGSLPGTVLGAWTLYVLPSLLLKRLLGAFVIGYLILGKPYRCRTETRTELPLAASMVDRPVALFGVGVITGYVSGALGIAGPLNTMFLLSFGLAKAAFVATNAMLSISSHVPKTLLYGGAGLFPDLWPAYLMALLPAVSLGSLVGKAVSPYLSERVFRVAISLVLVAAAAKLLLD